MLIFLRPDDEPEGRVIGEKTKQPVESKLHFISKPNQWYDMDKKPGEPCYEPGE